MASPILAALLCRCPRCNRGKLFSGFLTTVELCGVCGLRLGEIDNGDGPAVLLIFILGVSVVPLAIWASDLVDLPLWAQGAFWSVVILALTVGMLRPAKALFIALNYRFRNPGQSS